MDIEDDFYLKSLAAIALVSLLIFGSVTSYRHMKSDIHKKELLDSLKEENLRLEIEIKKKQLNK